MANIGLSEGNRIAPVRVDRDVIAAHENGRDGNDCIWGQFLNVIPRQFLNVVPRQCDGFLHDIVESAIHLHDE